MTSPQQSMAALFRGSRLVTIPDRLPSTKVVRNSRAQQSEFRPSVQILHSPASARHRGNWGLKSPVPQKFKGAHIALRELDILGGSMLDYANGEPIVMLQRKISSLPVNISINPISEDTKGRGRSSLLCEDQSLSSTRRTSSVKQDMQMLNQIDLKTFLQWAAIDIKQLRSDPSTSMSLLRRYLSGSNASAIASTNGANSSPNGAKSAKGRTNPRSILELLSPASPASKSASASKTSFASTSVTGHKKTMYAPVATAGVSYRLPGALAADSFSDESGTVPARFLDTRGSRVAVAGVIGRVDMSAILPHERNDTVHRTIRPVKISSISTTQDGALELYARPYTAKQQRVHVTYEDLFQPGVAETATEPDRSTQKYTKEGDLEKLYQLLDS